MTLDEVIAFLKEHRKSQNLRQFHVTAAGGPTASQISGLETGKLPSFALTKRYANAMGYDISFTLVKRPEEPHTKEENIAFRKEWDAQVEAGKEIEDGSDD